MITGFFALILNYPCAEGCKCELCKLKILNAEGNTYYRAAESCALDNKFECKPYSDKDYPKSIAQLAYGPMPVIYNFLAERTKTQPCEVEAHSAEGYSYQSNAAKNTCKHKAQRRNPAEARDP